MMPEFVEMNLTCKKTLEEFIYGKGEFLITVIGFEVDFSSNGNPFHVDLYKHMRLGISIRFSTAPLLQNFIW